MALNLKALLAADGKGLFGAIDAERFDPCPREYFEECAASAAYIQDRTRIEEKLNEVALNPSYHFVTATEFVQAKARDRRFGIQGAQFVHANLRSWDSWSSAIVVHRLMA
jgi:hypothetical protein